MNRNELRIGNLICPINRFNKVHLPAIGFPQAILEIHTFSVLTLAPEMIPAKELEWNEFKLADIDGIPLTEEWLVRLGWVWNEACNSYEKYPNGDARMNLASIPYGSYTMFNYVTKALICERIYHVHHLQNLYFALTGEELEIKNNNKSSNVPE